ncbi:hypothetical protein CFP65_0651 [Kitasatospora sp. MMS16-BH015]|uniref:hypothetical protein n=1 Tax=Kitasatospora sp. MMS16-BH015 TaxID=2018025 RepID=UPI000CA3F2E1|nr:hypothetical protein [Kitasatospora sp. MMS16-BH015]AUG75605.1 hypothetical protein CFP65_0651 [Kitasatospora sp. MMS16-BH015]
MSTDGTAGAGAAAQGTAAPGGRELAPAVPLLAAVVAVISILTGAAMAGAGLAGHAFGPWHSAGPLGPGVIGAAMVGVAPGLFLVGRARCWEEARALVLPTAVVLVGQFAVTVVNAGALHVAKGGNIVVVLFSLGWVAVTCLLALVALLCLALQYRRPARPYLATAAPLPVWSRPALAVLGSAWTGIGLGLLVLPGFWGGFVPWAVSRPDAQALGVWALALGVGVLGSLVEDDLGRLRAALVALPGVAVAVGVLLAGRASNVQWGSGPALALEAMVVGLLLAGLSGRVLLARPAA